MRTSFALLALLALSCASTQPPASSNPSHDVEWPAFASDQGGTHYSSAADITRENVSKLQKVWTYHTGALEPVTDLNHKAAFEATPVMVDGTLYVITPFNKVIALDPATGAERWTYDAKIDRSYSYSEVTSRGVSVWRGGGETRIFFGTLDGRLIAIDGKTGKPCADFGRFGQIDLKRDVGTFWAPDYGVTSPPAVIGDLVVVGSSIGDNSNVDTGRGVVRAFDVKTGATRWSFDPLLPMADGARSGAANAWGPIAADVARGLVFVPTSSPSPDYFGGARLGDNRYANSVVALRASTGAVVWSFQTVHHDLWDYDNASPPA
ncbi:MAG: PQQ-binding-like beta-propeller repeat protein, partial [Acidobacteria bacterium]|nr:PQQ-binding-like beta-propeller repeat protein [Acidobacteriota bacterium]